MNPAFKEDYEDVQEKAVEEDVVDEFTEENFGLLGKFFKAVTQLAPDF